jgi:16S rRNA (cytosine967-C5)-methyltransferase
MENTGRLLACDIHAHKINLLRQTGKRLGLSIIQPAAGDATFYSPEIGAADAVLLDAPCSGLGTLRKHPEIKYNRTADELAALPRMQLARLTNAARYVKPGGRLVYSTCTVAKPENEDVIAAFLAAHPLFSLEAATLHPVTPATDGFFVATIRNLTTRNDML